MSRSCSHLCDGLQVVPTPQVTELPKTSAAFEEATKKLGSGPSAAEQFRATVSEPVEKKKSPLSKALGSTAKVELRGLVVDEGRMARVFVSSATSASQSAGSWPPVESESEILFSAGCRHLHPLQLPLRPQQAPTPSSPAVWQ